MTADPVGHADTRPQSREDWLAATLLADTANTVDRARLRSMAPVSGSAARAGRYRRDGRPVKRSRAGVFVRLAIRGLEAQGLVRRDGDQVAIVDRAKLAAWVAAGGHWAAVDRGEAK